MSSSTPTGSRDGDGRRADHDFPRRDALCYLGLVLVASLGVAVGMPHSPAAPLASAFVPVAVLVVLTPILGRSVWSGLGLARPGVRLWPLAIGVPLVGATACYAVASVLDLLHPWPPPGLSASSLVVSAAIATVIVLGEEVGWRGFLLPRIQQLTDGGNAAILTAAGHAVVHLPLILLTTTYNSQGSRWIVAPLTFITITGAGIFYAWLRDASGSLWPAAIAHSAGNILVPAVLAAALPSMTTAVAYVAGEGGWVTAAVMAVVALTVLRIARRDLWRLTPERQEALTGRNSS